MSKQEYLNKIDEICEIYNKFSKKTKKIIAKFKKA